MGKRQWNVTFGKTDPKDDSKRLWIPLGKAFENEDGSVRVVLDALPVGYEREPQLVLHLFTPKKE